MDSTFSKLLLPSFTITRRDDGTFQFVPPHGSRELINALALTYPLEPDLENQIRRALLEFIAAEPMQEQSPPMLAHRSTEDGHPLDPPDFKPSQAILKQSHTSANLCEVTSHCSQPVERVRRKSRYTSPKRLKVAEVRKYGACDLHRKKKSEVLMQVLLPLESSHWQ